MSDKDELRRYLAQRLEAGETTLVLESVVSLGAPAPASGGAEPRVAASAATGAATPQPMPDWRAALQSSGAGPRPKSDSTASSTPGRAAPVASTVVSPPGAASVEADGPLPSLDSLDAIRAAVAGCRRCSLYATATNPVPGEGNPDADFMIVGEAPGATEDQTGKPFVGAAGKLLTQILEAIKLRREDVFICNVLKHRPPGNRNPEPEEVRACSPYLVRQIELIRPKVILALGTFSAQTLLETKTSIGKLRGQIHRYHGVPVVVTYHPAALLRNPAWKRPAWEDVQLARRILDSAVPGA